MSYVLDIDDINLNSDDKMSLGYHPVDPDVTVEQVINALQNGGELPHVTRRNVTESARILIMAADPDDLATQTQEIQDAFLMAELYQKGIGSPIYVFWQGEGRTVGQRSEILTGRVIFDRGLLDGQWMNRKIEATVQWTRRWFWELDEVELPLSNGGAPATGGVTVYNHNAADPFYNFVTLEPEGGVLPGPARIEIVNSVSGVTRNYTYYINHAVWSNIVNEGHILEAEGATGGSTVAAGTSSGGSHKTVSWVGSSTAEVLTWTLSTDLLNAVRGNYVRMLARFVTISAGIWLSWRIKLENSVIYQSEEVRTGTEALQELETLQLPPYLVGAGDLYPLTLTLCARKAGGGSFALDFVQMGILDGFRRLHPRTYGHQYNARLVDDGMLRLTYKDGAAVAGKSGHYKGRGEINLWPNRTQFLYFLWTREDGSAPIDRTISVRVYWRPRVLSL